MNNKVFAIICALWAVPAVAQQPTIDTAPQLTSAVPITLREAEQRAVDRNPSIAGARLGAEGAAFRVAESRAAYSPSFSATLARRSQTTPGTTQLSGGEQITNQAVTFGTVFANGLPDPPMKPVRSPTTYRPGTFVEPSSWTSGSFSTVPAGHFRCSQRA